MSQAKTLTQSELKQVLGYIALGKHAVRNRAMVLTTVYAGMRVGEVASLRYEDVVDLKGQIRSEIRLDPDQTKGWHGRVVFIGERLRKELQTYVAKFPPKCLSHKLFYTQKRNADGWSSNTLCQFFFHLYKAAGIEGASSHSGRRTLLTSLSSKGVGIRVLMKIAGHRNLSTTIGYIDASDDQLRKAVELA